MTLFSWLSRRGASDLALPAAALGTVALLFAPLPAPLLDVGIALNLGISAAVLLVTLFARDALAFASFPTLLLFTTLFRLALNVSSTRLVLARGDAGRVIEALGRVVVDGDTVVGVVVYAILATVQILVVAKGSERVAEVAARFTLDALPGKQMSIDADLRAGAIDQTVARARRRELERESQLYGAMDGALKFVKGDAFAGILIVAVNAGGGAVAGALRGMPVGDAFARYALLAIGDGLASQIPALLLAISAGVAVTRVSGDERGGALGAEIARQMLAEPRALAAVGVLLALLAVAPGLPAAPFALAAAIAAGAARFAHRRAAANAELRSDGPAGAPAAALASHARAAAAAHVEVELDSDLERAAREHFGSVEAFAGAVAAALWHDRGLLVDTPRVRVSDAVSCGAWSVSVDEVPVAQGRVDVGAALALAPPDELLLAAIESLPANDARTGRPASLVSLADAPRARALAVVRGPGEMLLSDVSAALRAAASELVGVDECQRLLEALEATAPALVREVSRVIPAATLAEVLRRLLEEQVSVRPLRLILQAVLEAPQAPVSAVVERCRRALKRHITRRGDAVAGDPLEALLIDPLTEARLREGVSGDLLALAPEAMRDLIGAVECGLADATSASPVLLAPADIRRPLRQLVAGRFPALEVLSYDELPPELPVRPIGRVALAA